MIQSNINFFYVPSPKNSPKKLAESIHDSKNIEDSIHNLQNEILFLKHISALEVQSQNLNIEKILCFETKFCKFLTKYVPVIGENLTFGTAPGNNNLTEVRISSKTPVNDKRDRMLEHLKEFVKTNQPITKCFLHTNIPSQDFIIAKFEWNQIFDSLEQSIEGLEVIREIWFEELLYRSNQVFINVLPKLTVQHV